MSYTKHFNNKSTAQTEEVIGKNQVENNAGGFVFNTTLWTQLRRFLILGSSDGSYYATPRELTVENAKNVIACIKESGNRVVKELVVVSVGGKAPKNDPVIFTLALVCTYGDAEAKQAAYNAVAEVCRTGTHIFTFCQYIQDLRGWSRGLRTAVARFYTTRTTEEVAYQVVKYRQRNGWTHKDVLRLSHAVPTSEEMNEVFRHVVGKENSATVHSEVLHGFELAKTATTKELIQLIDEFKLPWEALPTEALADKTVWEALLPTMGITALVRNLGKMTSLGVFTSNLDSNTKSVRQKFTDSEQIRKSKIHPMALLIALKTYESGHGFKGSLSWTPVQGIVDSLNEAFYLAFGNVTSTGKNLLVGVDVSGSMNATIQNTNLTCREASAAMALIFLNTEPNCAVVGFNDTLVNLTLHKGMRLDAAIKAVSIGGGTDCSIPMLAALNGKLDVDAFVILSDNETWEGTKHPFQALNQYRKVRNAVKPAKMIGVGMVANQFQLSDPTDTRCLNVVGFDTSAPEVITTFINEE